MDKRKIEFSCKVKGDFSPAGLQKVYFSYVDDDKEWIPVIAEDIWKIVDCAIYYHEETTINDDVDMVDFEMKLSEMKLFVIIVTTKYLTTNNLAKEKEYGFAVDNHIPILPIAMETGLEELFSSEMNEICPGYGDIQLLKYHVTDNSELSYQHKLVRDIKSVLVDNTNIEKIKKAFTSSIFLSYRKKDRKYANQLMRIIHSIPSLQRVAIWYDEYISTGEVWSNQIQDALNSSDIFLLMVTPALTETDNYVIREEYPAAKNRDMTIVPVRKASQHFTDEMERNLSQIFPDLQTLVDGEDADALERALIKIADNGFVTPETDYLIGLAFFNGINVEKDTERAVSLIFASAEKGLPEAIGKLADIYWNGDGLERNHEKSIEYRKELVNLYERRCNGENCDLEDLLGYISALKRLTEDLYELGVYRESYYFSTKLMDSVGVFEHSDLAEETRWLYASACDLVGKISMSIGMSDLARRSYQQYCDIYQKLYETDPTNNNYHNLSVGYERLGNIEYANANYKDAAVWYEKALVIRTELDHKLRNADTAQSLSCICLFIGDVYIRENHVREADKMYENALFLRRRIHSASQTEFNIISYGEAIISKSTTATLLCDYYNAEQLLKEADQIFSELAKKYGTIEAWRRCAIVLNREGGLYFQQGNEKDALPFYQESLKIRKKLLKKYRSNEAVYDCAITLYYVAQCYEKMLKKSEQMATLEEVVDLLLPILSVDRKMDWHCIFAEAAFDRFKIDTYSGKKYLQYAIQGWKWLSQRKPEDIAYKKRLDLCNKMYHRCYPG